MSRNLSEETPNKTLAGQGYGVRQLFRRPVARGKAVLHIKVFPDANYPDSIPVVAGDGMFIFAASRDMDQFFLRVVEAYVTTVSSSGAIVCQVRNITQAVDMLTTAISIDSGELNSQTATSQVAVDEDNNQITWTDEISIDVDSDGTGAFGLGMILEFSPLFA